jgi:hypothetical protein
VGAGFPHGDSTAHRVSYPLSVAAFAVSRALPHALALAATAPRAMTAAAAAAPAVVGLYKFKRDMTHSLKAPGFKL